MPFDERDERLLDSVTRALSVYRSSVAGTVEQVRSLLDDSSGDEDKTLAGTRTELGKFAAGRVDFDRFVAVLERSDVLDEMARKRMQRAFDVLSELAARSNDAYHVDVPSGGSLWHEVSTVLADFGRAFGAARAFEAARTGNYRQEEHDDFLEKFAFNRWNAAERALAPPLVVHVAGPDLKADGLASFVDGGLKLLLVVDGVCPPAALVRLISPGVFVTQTADESVLERLAAWDGPGVAALVEDGAARFVHDPARGTTAYERIELQHMPEKLPEKGMGDISAFQLLEQVRQLEALAAKPSLSSALEADVGTTEPAAPTDPVDKLAAWLLSQTDLSNA